MHTVPLLKEKRGLMNKISVDSNSLMPKIWPGKNGSTFREKSKKKKKLIQPYKKARTKSSARNTEGELQTSENEDQEQRWY